MIEIESIADRFALPASPDGWFDHGYAPLADQRLALVRTRSDYHADYMRWWAAFQGGDYRRGPPQLGNGDLRLSIFDGVAETDIVTVPSIEHPNVDRMPDGRWLVAGSRASNGEKNGAIYTADGRKEREIHLGDGIETMLCAPDGTIWVGYFDEGVFGGPNKDGRWPISCGGIVQFDETGRVLWSFNDGVRDDRAIADVYALTLSANDPWTCYYTDFPITRIHDGRPIFWTGCVSGANAIAVNGDMVLLGGGYAKDARNIAVVALEGEDSRQLGRLRYAAGKPGAAGLLQGRGSILHVVSERMWSKLSVYRAAEAIGAYDGSGGGT